MPDIPSHHLTYGLTEDFVTGERIVDSDDERYRQQLAQLLVRERGWQKKDIEPRRKIETLFSNNFVVSTIDLVVSLNDRNFFILRYGPGSLVTRERPALAAARVLDEIHQIPYAVVTNGEDAEFIDVANGKILATGLTSIPSKDQCLTLSDSTQFLSVPTGAKRERELRILNSYDIEICCAGGPCALPNAKEG
jgi:hypothetical protein